MVNKGKNEYKPDVVFPPGDTLQETIDAMGMSQTELATRMNVSEKHINEIVKGKATISEDTALRLERVLGIDASFWRNLENNYRQFLAEKSERERLSRKKELLSKFPLKSMIERGWIQKYNDPIDQLQEVLSFFKVATMDSWESIWVAQANFRQSPAFKSNPYAVAAWLRQGEILAEDIECSTYDKKSLREILPELRQLSTQDPEEFMPKIRRLCADCGVAVVFLSELPETRVCGVTRWIRKDKALIQLSDRYKSDDHFWFTLFHELGHIILHGKKEIFIEEDNKYTDKETEADKFAANRLIPKKDFKRLVKNGPPSLTDIENFAKDLQIAPGIVVGRLQHENYLSFNVGNKLKQKIELL